ncbi:MAG: DUF1565 domain-containing protein, partial [Okeania sp. SIO2H7]|nr:DUF1565 domain-containing protein [Okeania sp. SIO2H7]
MATLYVNPNTGQDSNNGSESSPFKTITKALQQATSGSTIQLTPGTYNAQSGESFPLLISSGVKVVGNEITKGKDILIKGSGTYVSPSVARQNITVRLRDDGYLGGVTVTNDQIRGTGVWFESSKGTLTKCTLTECKREGVFATGDANPA